MDKWAVYKKCDDYRVKAPKSVVDLIEIKSISENGIFEVGAGGIYTKTYEFTDANFQTESVENKMLKLEIWCRWLNSNSVPFKLTINNKNRDMERLKKDILLPDMPGNRFGRIINNEIIRNVKMEKKGIKQEFYLTVRYELGKSYEDAKNYFDMIEYYMKQAYRNIGSTLTPLTAEDRLRILHDFYCFGRESEFEFDFKSSIENGFDFKDAIINTRLDFGYDTYFKTDDRYVSAIYLKRLPESLKVDFLSQIARLNINMMIDIDIRPIANNDVESMLKGINMGVDKRIRNQNQRRVKDMDFRSDLSQVVKDEKEEVTNMIKSRKKEDQHYFYTMLNILVINDDLDELKKNVELIKLTAKDDGCIFDYSYMMQREALNTVLPIGVKQIANGRNMQTKSLAALFPFTVQELQMENGNWYGTNIISKNPVIVNRKKLLNPHGMVFGVTGSGKTTLCTVDMLQTRIKLSNDDIIVVDPKGDYKGICNELNGTYIDISTTSPVRYNPLEYNNYEKRANNIADEKAEFVLSVCETCKKKPLTAKESSIINRALKYAYYQAAVKGDGNYQTTLTDLYNMLGQMPETEARDVMLYMEMFITGSLNIFAGYSNVDVDNSKLLMFGLKKMGKVLRDISMLVMLECIKERVYSNYAKGIATWIIIDEFHELLKTEYTQMYTKSMWMLYRSLGGICTALTQNVSDVLCNDTTKAILENSEFVMVLKQKLSAGRDLIENIGIPEDMTRYVTDESEHGKGIIKCGNITVPFSMKFDENTEIFKVLDHNFHK